jgi:O-antigen/teichoic acid export membrane protein
LPVLRNALWLVGAQVLAAPLGILINAVAARFLGPADFGSLYLAATYAGFALLFIEWGQFAALTGKIAAQRSRAGELLGSAMVWRLTAAAIAVLVVPLLCRFAGYGEPFLQVLTLSLLAAAAGTVALAGQDAVRGFERTDFAAMSYVGQQLLVASVSVSVLVLGFGLRGLLIGQILCALVGSIFVLYMLPRLHIPRLHASVATILELCRDGRVFLTFVLVVQLQPLVDGAMMSGFASADSLGWYAVSRKLIGILTFPAAAVGRAMYPTLVRQFAADRAAFRATVHSGLEGLSLVVFPVALGCALFPRLGVMIFNSATYAPAEQNVRVLALWLFLLYITIPLSQCIMASGRQGRWTVVQFGCVIISAVADPLLIRWFQAHGGNGGLGVCVATVGSEVLMLIGAALLVPSDVLDWTMLRSLAKPALAGAVMAAVGLLVAPYSTLLGAIVSVLAYGGVLWISGTLSLRELRAILR